MGTLLKDEEDWPKIVLDVTVDISDKEVRKEAIANAIRMCDVSSPTDQLIAYFSYWSRLKTAVASLLGWKAMLLEQRQHLDTGRAIESRGCHHLLLQATEIQ